MNDDNADSLESSRSTWATTAFQMESSVPARPTSCIVFPAEDLSFLGQAYVGLVHAQFLEGTVFSK